MSWERRGAAVYYYAAKKIDGRTVKDYLGRGPAGELAARLDAARRRARASAAAAARHEGMRLAPADRADLASSEFAGLLLGASMASAGYYRRHRGPWRRRRGHGGDRRDP